MALPVASIGDLVNGVLSKWDKMKYTDLTGDYQYYIAVPKILKDKKITVEGGATFSWQVMKGVSGNAKAVLPYETDTPNQTDQLIQASSGWYHVRSSHSYDEIEMSMNDAGSEKIIDLIKVRRADARISLAQMLEARMWQLPNTDSNSKEQFKGVPYSVMYSASTGFNGGNPTGFSDCYGISASTYARWRNYTAQYTNVNRDDLLEKLRQAMWSSAFKSPLVPAPDDLSTGDDPAIYVNYATLALMRQMAEDRNENLGFDLGYNKGTLMCNGAPIEAVPYWDANATITTAAPVIGINWGSYKCATLKGRYMKEEPAIRSGTQSAVWTVFVNASLQMKCTDRRRQFMLAKSAPW